LLLLLVGLVNRSLPISLTFGYCFAVLPILSLMDIDGLFGTTPPLTKIPAEELSTPEEYLLQRRMRLELLQPTLPQQEQEEHPSSSVSEDVLASLDRSLESEHWSDDEEQGQHMDLNMDVGVATEETPLLPKD
jgi:hypothetical protein